MKSERFGARLCRQRKPACARAVTLKQAPLVAGHSRAPTLSTRRSRACGTVWKGGRVTIRCDVLALGCAGVNDPFLDFEGHSLLHRDDHARLRSAWARRLAARQGRCEPHLTAEDTLTRHG
jgi:hypothetical protein